MLSRLEHTLRHSNLPLILLSTSYTFLVFRWFVLYLVLLMGLTDINLESTYWSPGGILIPVSTHRRHFTYKTQIGDRSESFNRVLCNNCDNIHGNIHSHADNEPMKRLFIRHRLYADFCVGNL